MAKSIIFLSIYFFLLSNASAEEIKILTPRGAEISVNITNPVLRIEKAPVLVIAPGQGYHMDLPLVKELADIASQSGFITYRFNWNYFTSVPRGHPSEDLSNEAEDMQAVIAHAKQNPNADLLKILIAGKSLGTLVSYPLFKSDPSIAGLILMTPICTDPDTQKPIASDSYPGFAQQTRPIAIFLGNQDPLCSIPMLYDFLKTTTGNVSVNVFGGGHSLTFGKAGDPANADRDARNIYVALSAINNWANILVGK